MSQDMVDEENIKPRKGRTEKKPPKKITEKYLYNSGLAYLQKFTSSVPNFRRVMGRKINKSCNYHKDQDVDACNKMLDTTVDAFVRQGLLNDAAYLGGMINSLRRRGLSTQAILAKLQQKGLSKDDILTTLQTYDETAGFQNPDFAAAVLLIRRKRLGCFSKGDPEGRNRELAALARAGFSFEIAQKALALQLSDAEEILSEIRN